MQPKRQGLPRGVPVGFSKIKYTVNLIMLFDVPLKDIAKTYGVSYGLLKKWRTEPDFKKLLDKNMQEFTLFFIDKVKEASAFVPPNSIDLTKKVHDDCAKESIQKILQNIIKEPALYSSTFRDCIIDALLKETERMMETDNWLKSTSIVWIVSRIINSIDDIIDSKDKINKLKRIAATKSIKSCIEEIEKIEKLLPESNFENIIVKLMFLNNLLSQ